MRISAKGEYAIKAVLDLSLRSGDGLVPIQDIAVRQAIPQRYLEHVLLALKRAGLLGSKRGASGGYHLMRLPEEISVGDVLRAVEGSPDRKSTRLNSSHTVISYAVFCLKKKKQKKKKQNQERLD